jgi:hypothetical protein
MQELQETQLQFVNPLDFIKDQILYLLPFVFVWIAGLIWLLRSKPWRFLFWTYLFVIILLILGRGKSYYSMGIYPALLAAGSVAWERFTAKRYWVRYVLLIFIAVLTIPFIPMLLPIWKPEKLAEFYKKYDLEKTGLLKWEDQRNHPLPQDYADMLGWKELTVKAEKFFDSLPDSTKGNSVIYCRNYGQVGALQFYSRQNLFRSKVYSANGSFLLWIPREINFKNLLLVDTKIPESDDKVFQHFQTVTLVDSVTNIYSRQLGNKIIFYQNIDTTGLRLVKERLAELKNEFQR